MTGGELFEIVCHDTDPQWLEERRRLVTGSVAPQLLGVNRFGSLLGTYLRMREGADPEEIAPDRRAAMDWGTDQQDAIVTNIRRRLELQARRTGALLRSTVYPWIGCTLDGWVADRAGGGDFEGELPFEVKTTRSRDASELWDEGVPVDVVPQVQTQLLVTGAPRALVAAVIFGAPPAFTWVERDDGMIEAIVRTSRAFYERVERGEPPPPDGSKDAGEALAGLPREAGKTVELDIEAVVLAEDLANLKAAQKERERRIRELEQKLIRKLGDAEVGRLPGGGSMTYRETTRRGFVKVTGATVEAVTGAVVHATLGPKVGVSESKPSTFRVLRRSKK